MKRKLWTLLLALGAALALCVGASATDFSTGWDEVTNSTTTLESGKQYYLNNDVTVSQTITVSGTVTLDLNGHVLQYKNDSTKGSVIKVESGGHLAIQDSNTGSLSHKFTPNSDGLWVLDETSGTEEVKGGVITGGTGTLNFPDTTSPIYIYNGGGVYVAPGGALTMNGGSIVGCSGSGTINGGGGVYLGLNSSPTNPTADTFTMNGGRIIGCTAGLGGGVLVAPGCKFTMNAGAVIRSCTAQMGGGVYYLGMSGSSGMFTLNGGAIQSCKALGGGGGGVCNSGEFLIMENSLIKDCTSEKDSNKSGGVLNSGQLTISGGTVESNVTNSGTINADGGTVTGGVTNGGTISGSANVVTSSPTTFSGSVTNNAGGTIQMGTFTGSVINNGGKITGFCVFSGTVFNSESGTIAGGQFNGTVFNSGGTISSGISASLVNAYKIEFVSDGSSGAIQYVFPGGTVSKPADPARSGYAFDGWYTENTYENPYDFHAAVTGSLTLYAKWNAIVYSDPTYAVSAPTAENGKVTVSPRYAERGECVTVTLTPDEGCELESLTVTDSRGNELALTDKGDGRYTFTMPARRVEVTASFVETVEVSPFADMAIDAYCYEAVKWAVKNGITDGVGNSLFAPNQPCTRGQIVAFLWRAAGSPVVNYAMNMTDVAEDAYYAEAVRWALSEGITTGAGESSFSPDATCTRAQAVTFLARALNAKTAGAAEFSDVPTDSYFADAVAWAAANGVTEGIGGGLFGSDNSCTRGQIVTFLYRAYNK